MPRIQHILPPRRKKSSDARGIRLGKRKLPVAVDGNPSSSHADTEIELKLRVMARDLGRLRQRIGRLAPESLQQVDNIYFDTPDWRLAQCKAGLRLRRIDRDGRSLWLQTLKTQGAPGVLSARGEWECPASEGRLDWEALAQTPLRGLLGDQADAGPAVLRAVFRTRFERHTWELFWEGARIELALDRGWIEAGSLREAICELELELLGGAPASLVSLARALADGSGSHAIRPLALVIDGQSKAVRGYRLAGLPDPASESTGSAVALPTPVTGTIAHNACATPAFSAALTRLVDATFAWRQRRGDRHLQEALDALQTLGSLVRAHKAEMPGGRILAAHLHRWQRRMARQALPHIPRRRPLAVMLDSASWASFVLALLECQFTVASAGVHPQQAEQVQVESWRQAV